MGTKSSRSRKGVSTLSIVVYFFKKEKVRTETNIAKC